MIESNFSKARSAAFALATCWEINKIDADSKACARLNEMRKTCIDVICRTCYADDSAYDSLEKSYINNVISTKPDFDEIGKALDALAAINSHKAASLLCQFLHGLHQKKHVGTWSDTENVVFPWILNSLAILELEFRRAWGLLVTICCSGHYTAEERIFARDALIMMKGGG